MDARSLKLPSRYEAYYVMDGQMRESIHYSLALDSGMPGWDTVIGGIHYKWRLTFKRGLDYTTEPHLSRMRNDAYQYFLYIENAKQVHP